MTHTINSKLDFKLGWKDMAIELATTTNMSWRSIAKSLGESKSTVSDFLRKEFKEAVSTPTKSIVSNPRVDQHNNSVVLLISDLHIPYHHPDALRFLQYLKSKYKPTRVICMGDELDKHALSYHDSDPDLPSAGDEIRRSIPIIQQLFAMFPKMDILESNHGSLIWRKAKTHGIPRHYIKSYNDVLGVDDGWKWHFDLTIDLPTGKKCYFHHGKTSNVIQMSQQSGMCAVQGHFHELFKVEYWGNSTGLYWAMQTGCLIDNDSYAFSYNNVNLKKPLIGTALIVNGQPILEPLLMGEDGRWIN